MVRASIIALSLVTLVGAAYSQRTAAAQLRAADAVTLNFETTVGGDQAAFRLWTPADIQPVRAVVVLVPGANDDGRKNAADPAWQAFAQQHHLALVACFLQGSDPTQGTGDALQRSLEDFAGRSSHPEIASAPLLLYGASAGGQFDYNYVTWRPARVVAFIVNKGGFYNNDPHDLRAYAVPGLFFLGMQDEEFRIRAITNLWSEGRNRGALWALAPQPNSGHEFTKTPAVARTFFAAVLEARLPLGASTMKPMPASPAWLGDLTTHEIHRFNPTRKPALDASWLPDQSTAEAWKAFVTPAAVAAQATVTPPAAPVLPPIAYDAVSIHENKCTSCGSSGRSMPDGDRDINFTLLGFVASAYGVHPDRVSGLPTWAQEARYDVELKVAPEDMDAYRHLHHGQGMLMLRAVMADRFKLQAHVVPRVFPIYELVLAKGGPKLHLAQPGDTYPNGLKMPDGSSAGLSMGRGTFTGQQVTIDALLESLRNATGRRAVDKTGLTGKYDISLRWLPESGPGPMVNGEPDTSLPSIFTALEEQLGLKLEPAKGLEDTLVVDHIEPPTEN